jgi:hypothetical protein
MTVGAAVLYTAMGAVRPADRTYLSFGCVMALLAIYVYLQQRLYAATTSDEAVLITRLQVFVIHGFIVCMLVFVPAYTRVRLPRWLTAAYAVALIALFVVNVVAPYGLWFSARPELVVRTLHGEPYNSVVAPPMWLPQYVYAACFTSLLVVALACAVMAIRRGERQRGVTFAVAVMLMLAGSLADVFRDYAGGSWPYVAEFGVLGWGLIMFVQLAYEYRMQAEALSAAIREVHAQASRLRQVLDGLRTLEGSMHAPLRTLETGVATLGQRGSEHDAQLVRLQRAVARLLEFSRSMPDISARAVAASRARTREREDAKSRAASSQNAAVAHPPASPRRRLSSA